MKDIGIITKDGNLPFRSHAISYNGNAEHCQIWIQKEDGSRHKIYEGAKWNAGHYNERMASQGLTDRF